MTHSTNILIVDDNLSYRKFLTHLIGRMEGVQLLPSASSGRNALTRLQNNEVDIVLLDMQMPEMDGLETLKRIQEIHPEVGVIMISGEYASDADAAVQALEMGALDFLPKAATEPGETSIQFLQRHLRALMHQFQGRRNLNLARQMTARNVAVAPSHRPTEAEKSQRRDEPKSVSFPHASTVPGRIDLVLIGASTGGPNALNEVIPRLPGTLGVPVLVVQHMPAFLTNSLAKSINAKSALCVQEAVEGDPLEPGTVYIAPGGKHLLVERAAGKRGSDIQGVIRLSESPPENSVRPSVDVLFRSAADAYGGHVLAIIMTGMGSDGLKGVRELKKLGCYCLSQSEATCVVYGMPRAVDEAALSDERVALDDLADRITQLIGDSPVWGQR